MHATGKYIFVEYAGVPLTLCNQRCREWRHPYGYQGSAATLSSAGCGVFATAHATQYISGRFLLPDALAEFSLQNGGRGDDGTDRPALLSAMEKSGLAAACGFSYHFDGLLNDREQLFSHLLAGGVALCNLRPGHIVALLGARRENGEAQALAMDSYSESGDARILPVLRGCLPGSEIISLLRNNEGVCGGLQLTYGLYWAALDTVRDFNLLHRLSQAEDREEFRRYFR